MSHRPALPRAIELQIDDVVLDGAAFAGLDRRHFDSALRSELALLLQSESVQSQLAARPRSGLSRLSLPPLPAPAASSPRALGQELARSIVASLVSQLAPPAASSATASPSSTPSAAAQPSAAASEKKGTR